MAENTICLKTNGNPYRKEGKAQGAITPGDFIERASDGDFIRHTAVGTNSLLYAVENTSNGGGIDDDYATGDNVLANYAQSGDEVYGFVAASAVAIVIGDPLEFDGAGGFKKDADGSNTQAYALTAVDNSAGGSKARIKVEIL